MPRKVARVINPSEVVEKLVNENRSLVFWTIKKITKMPNSVIEDSDEFEIGMFTLFRCALHYDPSIAQFSTLFCNAIQRDLAKFRSTKYKKATRQFVSVKDLQNITSDKPTISLIDIKDTLAHLNIGQLSARQINIFRDRVINGETLSSLGRRYNMSKQNVSQIVESCRTKLMANNRHLLK